MRSRNEALHSLVADPKSSLNDRYDFNGQRSTALFEFVQLFVNLHTVSIFLGEDDLTVLSVNFYNRQIHLCPDRKLVQRLTLRKLILCQHTVIHSAYIKYGLIAGIFHNFTSQQLSVVNRSHSGILLQQLIHIH